METWDILNENNEKTGNTIERGQKLNPGEFHLVVHIWIQNDQDEYLVQKRAQHVSWKPGIWATTGGSVIHGEDSETAARREVKEELGITIHSENMKKISSMKRKDSFVDVWLVTENIIPADIILFEDEVSEVKWLSEVEVKSMIETGSFYNYGNDYFQMLFINNRST